MAQTLRRECLNVFRRNLTADVNVLPGQHCTAVMDTQTEEDGWVWLSSAAASEYSPSISTFDVDGGKTRFNADNDYDERLTHGLYEHAS